jgi:nucleoid DNA-binding protein
MAKAAPKAKPPSKTEILTAMADETQLSKKQVGALLDSLTNQITKAIGKKGPGVFTLPGLCKIYVHVRPAQPARKMRSPATGEMIDVAAKPARKVVKVRALKPLKELVG